MSKVYTSAVVIIPPKEKWASLQEIRKIYDRQFHRWMPHITLLYPFLPKTLFSELEKNFSKIYKQIKPFEISLNRIMYFHHGHQIYTMWLDPEPNNLIIELQAKLIKIIPDCDDVNKHKNGFTPHLSIGQIKGKKKLYKIIQELQNQWKELLFEVKEFYFISRENYKNSKFQIEKQIPLKI